MIGHNEVCLHTHLNESLDVKKSKKRDRWKKNNLALPKNKSLLSIIQIKKQVIPKMNALTWTTIFNTFSTGQHIFTYILRIDRTLDTYHYGSCMLLDTGHHIFSLEILHFCVMKSYEEK